MSEVPRPANPILRGMYPDPSLCRVGGTYYLVNSTFEYLPGIPIHESTDLVTWHLAGHAIHSAGQFDFSTVGDSRGMFAPTIRHHDGLFYVACTQMGEGDIAANFYVTAADVAGPWSDPVVLPDAVGIDPSLFFHEGRAWWTGCREVSTPTFTGETEVWLRELDIERGELVGPETVIWTRTQLHAVWAEGPHLYHRDGWFYLLTAEGGTSFEHSVMIARSRQVEGPYEPCPRNPVLTHRHLGHGAEVQNVGHADLFEGDDWQWWMVVLASRPIAGHHILGRETHLVGVTWEDGWPVVNPGVGLLDAPVPRPGRWVSDGVPSADDFLSVRGFAGFVEPRPEGLMLRSSGHPFGSALPVTALLRRLSSTECTASVSLDLVDGGATAGLMLRQSDDVHVRIELTATGGGVRAGLIVRNGEDTVAASTELPGSSVTLSATVSAAGITWTATPEGGSAADLGHTPLAALSTETAGGFVGTTFGPYVSGAEGASVLFVGWGQEDRA